MRIPMKSLLTHTLVMLALSVASVAEAKVFSFQTEGFAPYIRADYQPSALGQTPFSKSSGANNSFSGEYKYNTDYEFGFTYSFGDVALRFGFGVIKPTDLKGVSGKNAGGTELFTVDSNVAGYVPKLGIDFILKKWMESRVFMGAEVGSATISLQNSYAFTSAGQTAYSGMTNFREEVKGTGTQFEAYLGGETIAFDTTSIVLMVGYRSLKFASLSHNADVTSFQGAVTKGAEAMNDDGSKRSLDLSGAFASVAFRFWLF